jgi:hypothetical protein
LNPATPAAAVESVFEAKKVGFGRIAGSPAEAVEIFRAGSTRTS